MARELTVEQRIQRMESAWCSFLDVMQPDLPGHLFRMLCASFNLTTDGKVDDPEDIEGLAFAEHKSWSGWTSYMLSTMQEELAKQSPGISFEGVIGSLPCVRRWDRQMSTDYADLSEKEKESDRKVAREKLKVYRAC